MASRCLAGVLAVLVTGLVSCGDQREPASVSGGAAGGSAGTGGSFEPVLDAAGQYGETPASPYCEPNKYLRSGEDFRSCEWIPSCADVSCAYGDSELPADDAQPPTLACAQGYEVGLPAGACCYDCVRNQEPLEPVSCEDACPQTPPSCANGYRAVTRAGACCPECLADPDYCNADADCVLAKRPANCCACVVAVSTRHLDADDCYTGVSAARATPDGCQPDFACALVDCACPAEIPGSAACFEHHCSAR